MYPAGMSFTVNEGIVTAVLTGCFNQIVDEPPTYECRHLQNR